MKLNERIRTRRMELQMTLEEVASIAGVSKPTIQRYESGVIKNIPSDKIEKIARALRTTPAYLMGWENSTTVTPFRKSVNLSSREVSLINEYRKLPPTGKCEVDKYVGYLRTQYSDSQTEAKS